MGTDGGPQHDKERRTVRYTERLYLLYTAVVSLGFVLALPFYLWKGRATGKYLTTFRERMGRLPEGIVAGAPTIWIHAVSVGEVLAARILVKPLKQRFPGHRVFISTTTMTGGAVARAGSGGADGLFYAPFDWPGPVRRALQALKPRLLLLVETELWPNLIHEARRQGTRVAVVNGRISDRSFGRYRLVRAFLRVVLAEVDLLLMQTEEYARRVTLIGAPPERVRVVGNLKYDAPGSPDVPEALGRLLSSGSGPLWVAGSTVAGEEERVLAAFRRVLESFPDARLLIAPRHPERFDDVLVRIEAAGFRCVRRTRLGEGPWGGAGVLLLDTIGELAGVYPAATVVFVGGSLVPSGGHNVLEPALAGKAVIVGPHMENFQEIADTFLAEGALVQVRSDDELGTALLELLGDAGRRDEIGRRARSLVERNRGALDATLDALGRLVA
jgi:3-deoxy-D-manno-octulosonic-acid transferase